MGGSVCKGEEVVLLLSPLGGVPPRAPKSGGEGGTQAEALGPAPRPVLYQSVDLFQMGQLGENPE